MTHLCKPTEILKFFVSVCIVSLTFDDVWADQPDELPTWLQNKLDSYKIYDPLITAHKTTYRNNPAYYIAPRCCDIPSELYDAEGKLICHPTGNISGGGDGQCPDWNSKE